MKIHQIGSVLAAGDAVTNHIGEIDRRLTQWGLSTAIYGADIAASPLPEAQLDRAYAAHANAPDDVLIYHYSAYCDNYKLFLASRNRKILIYHNITPAEYYRPYDSYYYSLCTMGREILPQLAACDLALGVSEYNRQELLQAGFAADRTGILPLFITVDSFERTPRAANLARSLTRDKASNILFVGRVAPNKAFEDVIRLFGAYHRYVNRHARLVLLGARFLPAYDRILDSLVNRLGLGDAVKFTNRVPLAELRTYYETADLFLCASRHEGFCAPLLEAMYFKVPILARACAGVPDTLGRSGVLFHKLAAPALAELMALMIEDGELRSRIVDTQRARLADFSPEIVERALQSALEKVTGSAWQRDAKA